MKKKEYIKPSFKVVDVHLNELCVGSVCKEVDIIIPHGAKQEKTNIYVQGDLGSNMWDSSF